MKMSGMYNHILRKDKIINQNNKICHSQFLWWQISVLSFICIIFSLLLERKHLKVLSNHISNIKHWISDGSSRSKHLWSNKPGYLPHVPNIQWWKRDREGNYNLPFRKGKNGNHTVVTDSQQFWNLWGITWWRPTMGRDCSLIGLLFCSPGGPQSSLFSLALGGLSSPAPIILLRHIWKGHWKICSLLWLSLLSMGD